MAERERLSPTEIEVTPAMIDAGASVLAAFDRLEMSENYARQLTEEILIKSQRARNLEI